MGRAEKRRAERLGRKLEQQPTYSMTRAEVREITQKHLNKEIDAVRKKALQLAVWDLTAVFLMVLHDEFEFGKKRMEKFLERANTQFECVNGGHVTVDDMKQWCREHKLDYKAIFQDEPEERIVKLEGLGVTIREKE